MCKYPLSAKKKSLRGIGKMRTNKLLMAVSEALVIYGLIIVAYGVLSIHVTKT